MRTIILIFSITVVSIISNAQNKINSKAELEGVTVYTSSAELKYSKEVSLSKGKNIVVFSDLSPFIVENSINVSVKDKSTNIITVTDKINYLKVSKSNRISEISDKLESNTLSLENVESEIEVIEMEKLLLFKDKGIGGVSNGVQVSEIEKASQFFSKRYTELNNRLIELKRKKSNLTKENRMYNAQINQETTITEERISEIIVVVNSSSTKKETINFSFLTYNAGWAPLYDFKFLGHDKNLKFNFRANVFNASNTNWNDTKLILSTASPTVGFELPSLNKKGIEKDKKVVYKKEEIDFKTIEINNVITDYKVKHAYTIPSDGKPYIVDVDSYTMPATFSYILIPELDKNGFLMANIPNWNNYNLISGSTNIYNNGTFLGKTFLNTNTNNDTLQVYLGKDNKIEAYRKEVIIENPRNIIGNYFVDKTYITFSIKNNYKNSVRIELLDQVPVFDVKDKVKMDIKGIENAFHNMKDGSVSWDFKINPDETISKKFNYIIKAPKELSSLVVMKKRSRRALSCPAFL